MITEEVLSCLADDRMEAEAPLFFGHIHPTLF